MAGRWLQKAILHHLAAILPQGSSQNSARLVRVFVLVDREVAKLRTDSQGARNVCSPPAHDHRLSLPAPAAGWILPRHRGAGGSVIGPDRGRYSKANEVMKNPDLHWVFRKNQADQMMQIDLSSMEAPAKQPYVLALSGYNRHHKRNSQSVWKEQSGSSH
ncbi:hypothetical protein B0H66DRAFT_530343 [Apodospora peruviana]|uniref:Uncharacterized protein n=1 Tax=Apodospora peruviana TaxID=516989 RepID=A0AAE0IJK9_9PEZI|nr:hypothetical protein B0H66DRAFT_530343 [Apodospora peruviana]